MITVYLAHTKSIIDHGSIFWLIPIGILVLFAIADPLVHLIGYIVHECSQSTETAVKYAGERHKGS